MYFLRVDAQHYTSIRIYCLSLEAFSEFNIVLQNQVAI